ncbi:MAG: hypothetical protein A3F26_03650 [Candidatus Ryanbacteria bacterium RIFCSPHIGHO2_12_FULL_47_12b]|uniref:Gfo/Idh/MocA-like oxidoreductase N-terminal domain-containing protein n=2 Tax=Candidatus Ryaniibacteriota TaxID=1817914 RepID=A0A1G2H6F6_9BACT|nr:MAG: hypothetical protein A2844_01755 [Candidatus Ryanbacteria bacterium RIFCSPHIGHO2_01_FULL_48_80]OGZ53197.1 MAG: hypothetical protein A3F26_03650 [Candidatus Ryanbacteria bacterium RIFCSPHIGHO2_12_FULL_47_12b]OGZ55431.1 MAG: hypothetical protein A3J04_03415 [Candidatus Ryanbacteria bacterium RIFCSPLOWO2_02_FULL_47_14]OGZ57821.1 MAG: hypothetical protein A3G60_01420 [Candidatus Ryanbacteria bacterium RIFCSPLOWO2_12_FULL_47_9c]
MRKTLLIGYGQFGKILFEKLQKLAEVEIAAHEWREKLAGKDWAIIATPVASHVEITRDCLEAGLNVFCEKPLSENPREIEEIFDLAKEKNRKIYIDDVFLWRQEYGYLSVPRGPLRSISFEMKKYGTFHDSLLSTHVYHDLYMLISLVGFGETKNLIVTRAEAPLEKGRIDILDFSLAYSNVPIIASYDRTQQEKTKKIAVNENALWLNDLVIIDTKKIPIPAHDALMRMLEAVLNEKVDFSYNNKLALEATRLLAQIKEKIAQK